MCHMITENGYEGWNSKDTEVADLADLNQKPSHRKILISQVRYGLVAEYDAGNGTSINVQNACFSEWSLISHQTSNHHCLIMFSTNSYSVNFSSSEVISVTTKNFYWTATQCLWHNSPKFIFEVSELSCHCLICLDHIFHFSLRFPSLCLLTAYFFLCLIQLPLKSFHSRIHLYQCITKRRINPILHP